MILALAGAIAVVCWQWYDTRSQIASIREELALRLRTSDTAAGESLCEGIRFRRHDWAPGGRIKGGRERPGRR